VVELRVQGYEIRHSKGDLGDGDVLIAVVVAKTGRELIEAEAARERAMSMVESVISQSSDEARNSGDFVSTRGESSDYEAEAVLGEREGGVDVELST
jgi:hypothetical protein